MLAKRTDYNQKSVSPANIEEKENTVDYQLKMLRDASIVYMYSRPMCTCVCRDSRTGWFVVWRSSSPFGAGKILVCLLILMLSICCNQLKKEIAELWHRLDLEG